MKRIITESRLKSRERRSQRYSQYGQDNEDRIYNILVNAKRPDGSVLFSRVIRHLKYSPDDFAGKDFTVVMVIDGHHVAVSFGITISLRRWNRSKKLHPNVPQLYTEIGSPADRIIARVCELFRTKVSRS